MNANGLIILIIAFTCVGLFIATVIATVLDLFNLLKLASDIRKKLHTVLLVETVVVSVAAFSGFLNPKPVAQRIERVEQVEGEKLQLEKQFTDSTKANQLPVSNLIVVEQGLPVVAYDDRAPIYIRSPDVSRARRHTELQLDTRADFTTSTRITVEPGVPQTATVAGHKYRVGYWQMGVIDPDPREQHAQPLDMIVLSVEKVE